VPPAFDPLFYAAETIVHRYFSQCYQVNDWPDTGFDGAHMLTLSSSQAKQGQFAFLMSVT